MAQNRALRFLYPGLDAAEDRAGLQFTARGSIDRVSGDDSVRQAILLLISTRRGERVMRPDYGCDIHKLLFAPNDGTTAGLAIYYVRRALDRWEPRIDVIDIDAGPDPASLERLVIALAYRIRVTNRTGTLTFSFDLTGGIDAAANA